MVPSKQPEQAANPTSPSDEGYQFIAQIDSEKTPDDFRTDPATGLRPGETKPPYGFMTLNMKFGDLQYKTLPSILDWEKGKWWDQLSKEEQEELAAVPEKDQWGSWVISGEGTPGNTRYRCYVLPTGIASEPYPDHPSMWPKKKEEKTTKTEYKAANWEKKTESKLPFGMRIRCVGCGHWFKQDDIGGHVLNTCPAVHGDDCDWAIMCECGGTCSSLDDVVKLKAGFPRPKKVEPAPEATETKPELLDDLETTPPQEVPTA